jgi:hypothetical protein
MLRGGLEDFDAGTAGFGLEDCTSSNVSLSEERGRKERDEPD